MKFFPVLDRSPTESPLTVDGTYPSVSRGYSTLRDPRNFRTWKSMTGPEKRSHQEM